VLRVPGAAMLAAVVAHHAAGYLAGLTGSVGPVPRILLAFEPPEGGVTENVVQLVQALPGHGFAVDVAGPMQSPAYAAIAGAGAPIHRLPLRPAFSTPADDRASLRALRALLRSGRYDLVHCHSAKAGVLGRLAARRAAVASVYSPHSFPFVGDFSDLRRRFATGVERLLAPRTARIICVCRAELEVALAARIAPAERLRVVYNGCADCDSDIAPDSSLQALRAGGVLAGSLAQMRPQKRVDVFVDAAALVLARADHARIAVVGHGPLREQMLQRAERLGLTADPRFAFLPFERPAARYLRALDVYALSSSWEAFPIGVLEAQACGVPQVATAVGGTGEAVDSSTGRLVAPDDPPALAAAILELMGDDAQRARMAAASRARHAERFRVERMVAETADVYREVLAERR
jgi:glycosyltransferase involved in cell wall biosynthesis